MCVVMLAHAHSESSTALESNAEADFTAFLKTLFIYLEHAQEKGRGRVKVGPLAEQGT